MPLAKIVGKEDGLGLLKVNLLANVVATVLLGELRVLVGMEAALLIEVTLGLNFYQMISSTQ